MHTQWESLANEHILGIAPYEPGKPIEELERELGIHDPIKLASNENPLPPSDRVQKAIIGRPVVAQPLPGRQRLLSPAGARQEARRDARSGRARQRLERAHRARWCARFLRPGDEAVVPHPSFVVYPMIVQAAGGIRVMVMLKDYRLDLDAMARAITPMTKMVFIANPNNPTATIVTRRRGRALHGRACPSARSSSSTRRTSSSRMGPDFPDTLALVKQGRKVVVLRTFSKAASLAGLRVGLRRRRRRRDRADEPDPPALQRQLAGPGGRARRPSTTRRTCWSACG